MISYFPDINIWIALSVYEHVHHERAMHWLHSVRREDRLIFSRYTQVGFLRLLTNVKAIENALTTLEAWTAFDRWLKDPRVELYPEPRSVDTTFRQATAPFSGQSASKMIGDCYLLAFARATDLILVTFDNALNNLAERAGYASVMPA